MSTLLSILGIVNIR